MRGCFDRCCVCQESNCTQNKLLTDEFGIAVKRRFLKCILSTKKGKRGCALFKVRPLSLPRMYTKIVEFIFTI